jgi:hypothetical protein
MNDNTNIVKSDLNQEKIGTENTKKVTKENRIPVFKQKKYNYAALKLDEKNFHYHWANVSNSMGNNLERYFAAGYEQVRRNGKVVSRAQGKNEEGSQYLLQIPIDQWKSDQEAKLDIPREIEQSMKEYGHSPNTLQNVRGVGQNINYGSVSIDSIKGK